MRTDEILKSQIETSFYLLREKYHGKIFAQNCKKKLRIKPKKGEILIQKRDNTHTYATHSVLRYPLSHFLLHFERVSTFEIFRNFFISVKRDNEDYFQIVKKSEKLEKKEKSEKWRITMATGPDSIKIKRKLINRHQWQVVQYPRYMGLPMEQIFQLYWNVCRIFPTASFGQRADIYLAQFYFEHCRSMLDCLSD